MKNTYLLISSDKSMMAAVYTIAKQVFIPFILIALTSGYLPAQPLPAQPQLDPSKTLSVRVNEAASLYDARGFLKDNSRTVDGELSVSGINGNVQYRYTLSQEQRQGVPITVSLNYNQNASYTTFATYESTVAAKGAPTWRSLTRNRPAWILGVNGFAVQAFTWASRNVVHKFVRDSVRAETEYFRLQDVALSDKKMMWLLEGYDYCNRMTSLRDVNQYLMAKLNPSVPVFVEDVIKLLREDGSILELIRREPFNNEMTTSEHHDYDSLQPFLGTYVTAEPNSAAYAEVFVSTGSQATYSHDMLQRIDPDPSNWPRQVYPRVVRYYPGDGTTLIFQEVVLPYGVNQCRTTSCTEDISDEYKYDLVEASPTIFYLESIVASNGQPVAQFEYDGHNEADGSRLSTPRAGRANLIAFDNHTISYRLRGVDVTSGGRTFRLDFDESLKFGSKDDDVFERTYESGWDSDLPDAPSSHRGMTWLLTSITDPERRITTFEYKNRSVLLLNTGFPRAVSINRIAGTVDDNLKVPQGIDYPAVSCLGYQTAALSSVKNQLASFNLKYHHEQQQASALQLSWAPATFFGLARDAFQAVTGIPVDEAYYLNNPNVVGTLCSRGLVDAVSSVICNELSKYDRVGSVSMQKSDTPTPDIPLWTEQYFANTAVSCPIGEDCEFATTVVRTCFGNSDNTNATSRTTNVTTWLRTQQKDIPYLSEYADLLNNTCFELTLPQRRPVITTLQLRNEVSYESLMTSTNETPQRTDITIREYWPWVGKARNIKSELTSSKVNHKDIQHSRYDYTYGYDSSLTMNYASSQTNRAWQVVAYFARPLKNVIKTESRQAGSLWTAALRTTTELLNLAKGDLMRSIETYPNVTKLERLYRWRNYWRTMDSDLQLQKWTAAEAEAAFNEPDSVTRDTWLFYEYTDPNDVGPDGIQSDFMTVDQDDRDMVMLTFPGSPPHFGLAASKELLDISDGASISLSKVNLTYQEVTSFSRGLPLTRTTFGRSGLRSNSESYTYDNLTMSDILLSSKTMSSGSKLLYRYRGAGLAELPELIQDTKTTATLVTDVSLGNDRIHKDVSVLLGNTASLFNHLPTSQVTELRKPTTIGGTSLFRIATSSAYDVMGNILDRIDENGYLSRFSYDGIGRLLTAWLPLDFSDPDATNFDPLPYDADSTDRNYLVTGQLYDNHLWKQLICNSQSDLAPEVRDINPSQLLQYPKDLILFDPLESSDGIRFVLGSRELGSPDCSMTRECVNNSQPVIAPGPTEFCRFFVQTARYPAFRGNIHYNRSEHINIRSAELHVQLSRLSDDAMDCFPINIAIRDTNGAVLQSWTNYLVNCISIDTVSTSGGTQLMGLSNNGAPRDKQYDLVFQLDVATLGLETRHRQDPDFTELTVEVSTTEDAVGIAYFAGANIIVQGDFVSVDRVSYTDFTLGFRYLDDDQRKAAVYSKIDDRSTTQDDTRYPSLSNYVVYPRHAKRRVTFTTDDLVRYDERGFNKDQMRLLATDILPPSNKSMLVYDGAGKLVVTSNPLNLETQTSFDAIGRVTETEQGLILRGVNPTSISTQVTPSKDSGSKVTTTHSRVQRSSLVCFSPQQLSRLGNVVDVEQVDILEDAASRTSLKVYDERDRVKFSVDGYVAAQTDQPDQNLITEYFYDILDRIVQVVNPAGQLIRYTYDDFSNVASTEQVDMGKVDYAYDRHGRLRFSQTAEQRQCAAVLMRQYDDLGRPTIIGEARINSLLQNQGQRVIDFLNPDRMNIADDGLSHDPTINPTTFTVPTQPVPSVYTAIPFAPCAGCSDGALVTITPPCAELTARSSSSVFNPAESPLGLVINKPAAMHAVTTTNANEHDFENISTHPEFVLQALWYDELPINIGAIWGGSPQPWVWDAMASTGKVRNLVARPSIIAYRTHGGQPFHYIVHSYDERGRVECILRLTENLGFDAVYYSYNSMNKVTSVHTVDARGQHATFYGYDEEGRVFRMWTATSNQGFSPSMKPRKPVLVSRPNDGAPGAEFTYNLLNAVNNVEYPLVNMTTTHTYNDAGMLLRSTTTMQGSAQTLHDEALKYGRSGLIEEKYTREGAQWLPDIYWYDQVGRLAEASSTFGLPFYAQYNYDRVGNRLKSDIYESNGDNTPLKYTHTPSGNQLMRVAVEPLPIGQPQRFLDEMTYDPDGSLITRVKNRTEDGWRQQKIESFAYDPFNLIHIYNVQAAATSVAAAGCAPDATQAPVNQWHYRFGPLQEREQKRQYLTSRADSTLAWVYTLLGADGKQLATYNGLQGALCGGTPATLQIWPVEFNSYGPSNTRLITRANGRTEYVVSDYLGSTRQLINDEGQTLQKLSHRPFGITATSQGSGARTSYIGREHENETDLGFFGVRLYEPEYGRFLSTDVLWGSYAHVQPYQYSFNQPVSQIDAGGKWVEAKTQQAQDAVRNSVPSCFHDAVTFNKDGILNAGPLVEAANGQDSESNIANLAGLATHADGVEIMVLQPKEIIEVSQFSSNGEEKSLDYSFEARNAGRPPSNQAVGETLPGKFFSGLPDVPTGQDLSHSTNENTKVVLAGGRSDAGVTAAHEFIHVKFLFLHAGGFTDGWRHGNQKVEEAILKAEAEATK